MRLFKRLSSYLRPYRGKLAIAILCMASVAGLNAARIYLIKPLQDQVFLGRDWNTLQRLIYLLPLISLLLGICSYTQNYLMSAIGQKAVADLRQVMFLHMQRLSLDFFTHASTGKIVARFTNDLAALQNVIARAPLYLIRDGLTVVINIGLIFYLNWRFALLVATILPVGAAVIVLLGKRLRRVGRKGQEQMGELFSVLQENVTSASIVKAYTAEQTEAARFAHSNRHFLDLGLKFARTDTLSSPLMELIGTLILALLLWRGGIDVVNGAWTPGAFVAFITYAVMTYRPLKNFAELNSQVQLGLASSERVFELLDQKPSVHDRAGAVSLPSFHDEIVYDDVSFQYPNAERPALDRFSLRVRAGELVALVGSSGAGKTTVAMLLPRFYDPTNGQIRIDGHPLTDVTLQSLRSQIGMVSQEVILFNETVRYNIAYGRPGAKPEDIESSAAAANARDFILRLPQGYDTVIGERGVRLSGGERQRLSIARAILKNPPILVLDEATSALDAESERLVQEALERLMARRTAIVIAHRLSTVRKADRIVVLNQGRIAEEGTHDLLVSRNGIYAKLHQLQVLH